MKFVTTSLAILVSAGLAQAKDLNIVADIDPVASLMAKLTDQPITTLIEPGQSPHDASLKPSQARALSKADIVVWIGESLTPALEGSIEELAGNAIVLELLSLDNIPYLAPREEAVFESHDDHDGHDDHAKEAHEDHDDHDKEEHSEHADHDDHGEDKHDDHDDHAKEDRYDHHDGHKDEDHHDDEDGHAHHDHGDTDPHAWLDPAIAALWLSPMADALASVDPDQADAYKTRAADNAAALGALADTLSHSLETDTPAAFYVAHDAFQYLETAFDINVVGAVSSADGAQASVARVKALQDAAKDANATCLLSDATVSGATTEKMAANFGLKAQRLEVLFSEGPRDELASFYDQMLQQVVAKISECQTP